MHELLTEYIWLRLTPLFITERLVPPTHSQTESLKTSYQCITQPIHHTVSLRATDDHDRPDPLLRAPRAACCTIGIHGPSPAPFVLDLGLD